MENSNNTKPTVQELTNLVNSAKSAEYNDAYREKCQEIYASLRNAAENGRSEVGISYVGRYSRELIIDIVRKEFPELTYTIREDDGFGSDPHDIGASYVIISGW